jgi:hypothetical protein
MTELLLSHGQTGSNLAELPRQHPEVDMPLDLYDRWIDLAYILAGHESARSRVKQEQGQFWAPLDYQPTNERDPKGDLTPLFAIQKASAGDAVRLAKVERLAAEQLRLRFAGPIDFMAEDWELGLLPRYGLFRLADNRQYVVYNYSPRFRFTGRILEVPGDVVPDTRQSTPGLLPEIDMSPRINMSTGDFVPFLPGEEVTVLPHPGVEHNLPPGVLEWHIRALQSAVHPKLLEPTLQTFVD